MIIETSAFAEAVAAGRYGVQYEPIVELATGRRCAYEALARFHARDGAVLPTEEVFAWLHGDLDLLAKVELELKTRQVSHAPPTPLFVNLDPDSYARAREAGAPLLEALGAHRAPVVVEVVESVTTSDAGRIRRMIRDVQGAGLGVALDDLGAPNALVSLESLVRVEIVKFDRSVLQAAGELRYRALVESLLALARRVGVRSVLEGVETRRHLAAAEALGFDLVQGYLFRDDFIRAGPPRPRGARRLGSAARPGARARNGGLC